MKEKLIRIWKDPVWSKIISAVLLAFFAIIYNALIAHYNNTNFSLEFLKFWLAKIDLWIVVLIILVTYVISYYVNKPKAKIKFLYDSETIELDRKLFNRIRNELISKETLDDLYNNTFSSSSFEREKFNFINITLSESENPEFEFLNPEMEFAKLELITAIKKFRSSSVGSIYSAPSHGDIGFYGIPKEWDQERFYAAMDKIELEERNVFEKAERLIKLGRRILKI
ncbi:hypothetical protein [Chryseobacterium aurantiacum]|uniref:hypothetical protein n=1 Tax=Chryseobacterium aurantiacum TaxID=2116499 RepID=UPI000D138A5B|nr:hypothetical protein [Chryseobacterium aurantiacum]